MSGRTVPRFTLAGLLVAALAAPAVAQQPNPWRTPAPAEAPRPVSNVMPSIKLTIFSNTPALAPMPREKADGGIRIAVPSLGPLVLALDSHVPLNKAPGDHRQLFNFSVGVFGADSPTVPPMPVPAKPGFCEPDCCRKPVVAVMPTPVPPCSPAPPRVQGSVGLGNFSAAQPVSRIVPTVVVTHPAPVMPRPAPTPQFLCAPVQCQPGSFIVGGPCDFVRPMPGVVTVSHPVPVQRYASGVKVVEVVRLGAVTSASPVCSQPDNAICGTWYREMPGMVLSATFTHDELKLCLTQSADGHRATITLTAHYTMTKDGLVYGAITGADVDVKCDPKAKDPSFGMELAEMSMGMQALVDSPFSFRVKHTSAGMMVSQVKCGTQMPKGESEMFGGMFKPAKNGCVPAPTALKTAEPDRASSEPVERIGFDFDPPLMSQPVVPACPTAPRMAPPCPTAPPVSARPSYDVPQDSTKVMAAEAFGQMLQQNAKAQPCVGGMTLPSPRYLENYPRYIPADACLVQPAGALVPPSANVPPYAYAPATPQAAKLGVTGTWYREIGPVMCVIEVKPDHFTVTAYMVGSEDGKPMKQGGVITADYYLTRDGCTIIGLITGLDTVLEGDLPEGLRMAEEIGRMQKMFVDQPFAASVRLYGDTLVIGNVKAPGLDGKDSSVGQMLAGRYKNAGDKPVPQSKSAKVKERTCLPVDAPMLTPPPLPGAQYPVPLPPVYTAPSGDLIPPTTTSTPPAPVTRYGVTPGPTPRVIETEPAPPMTRPTPLVPMMPQPTPPSHYGSEELKQLYNEWRRFWFNDQPGHLTPERIHGGIY